MFRRMLSPLGDFPKRPGRPVCVSITIGTRPIHLLTGIDLGECLDAAHDADPYRGQSWYEAFVEKAESLGYHLDPKAYCHCDPRWPFHAPDCGLVIDERERMAVHG